ncbi:DUF2264 domain-containing protein [Melissococcus plutonius]|uniref:DUF2264 domain-containing protein n=1 Tax=Melissococcus plutonius TaxID=33970 RepID=UPI00065E1974|nr:DUF2264 domain-containing protein [Melissococcus plutonius]KMT41195.1 hypothetical protein MEPL12_1c03890 [Melissococcus plutonius]
MIHARIKENKFESYGEVAEGFEDLMAPLADFFTDKHLGHLYLGTSGTVYPEKTRAIEAFLRPLWGLGPYLTQKDSNYLKKYLAGIIAGVDPKSLHYWGKTKECDQLFVEMASLSTFLLLNKEKVWHLLTHAEKQNLYNWLNQINQQSLPRNNWHFFRVLVNLAMKHCELAYNQDQLDEDLAIIDSFYIGKGWYCDGSETQIDYYVSFAIHYYSLLYCRFMPEDKARVATMKERAVHFAQTFKYWFTKNGEAMPFGRSLTYRFSQVAFFSALVFADVEALPWGEIKGIISRHLHHWMNQEIFTPEGLLSIGYYYQNMIFAEGYNGPGSPYWSFKTFTLLAVPKDHPYWQAEALPLTIEKTTLSLPESKNYYQFNEKRDHTLMFPSGQFLKFQSHPNDKYGKFVYSSYFGFSTAKNDYWYYEGGFDNCLALAEDDHYFRTKALDTAYQLLEDRIIHKWMPWQNVTIKTTIVPLIGCHVRIHEIITERELFAYEGGFSIPVRENNYKQVKDLTAEIKNDWGISKISGITGFETADIIQTEPNTNLCYPLVMLPHVKTKLGRGKHLLISLVTGLLLKEKEEQPTIVVQSNQVKVSEKIIDLS